MPTELIEPEERLPLPVWAPQAGPELKRFLARKPAIAARLEEEALRVLGACVQPGTQQQTAGLVLGYVQSGKTSSFTAVSALARDNGYKLVIVIGGISHILVNQTINRLKEDLNLGDADAYERWILCERPGSDASGDSGERLQNILRAQISGRQLFPGIPIVAAMKNTANLAKLIALLRETKGADPRAFDGISALIIDDEAHMHTPNVGKAKLSGEDYTPSKIYSLFRELRSLFPSHTLLQYTATPQANLLAELDDELSPDFVKLLKPGSGYTGGQHFFGAGESPAIRTIPEQETKALQDEDEDAPTDSLKQAFASFVIVCANDYIAQPEIKTHSMLVHSDVKIVVHERWYSWLLAMQQNWQSLLHPSAPAEDRLALEEIFQGEHAQLKQTTATMQDFAEIMKWAPGVLASMHIKLVNSSKHEKIEYALAPYWVLCGGNMLGVGYTVEGLCTTHMVRPAGQRQIDTIQQRGRFFGYRQNPDRCRIWITADVSDTFADYVDHEEAIRESLAEYDLGNKSLRGWKRVFFLDPRSKLTRARAIKIELLGAQPEAWTRQQERHLHQSFTSANRALAAKFLATLEFARAPEVSGATGFTQHQHAPCSLRALREFLVDYKFSSEGDAARFTVIRLMLGLDKYTRDFEQCDVYWMAAGLLPDRRERKVGKNGKIDVHQGRGDTGADKAPDDSKYKGDASAHHPSRVSLQVFSYNLKVEPQEIDVPFIALWLPEALHQIAEKIRAEPNYRDLLE